MLLETIRQHPENTALSYERDGSIEKISYREFGEMIQDITLALAKIGLASGDRIAILSNNRPEWTISDFASFSMGAVIVPIYQTLPPNQIAYLLHDSETRAIFVENEEQYNKIRQIKKQLPHLEFVFSFDIIPSARNDVHYFTDLLHLGREELKEHPERYAKLIETIDRDQICSIVYTSGTTGQPKGVMLNHSGFIWDIVESEKVLNLVEEDVFLSFLPLSHLYERLAGHWCPMLRGGQIHYAKGIDTVVEDIGIARPSVITAVPRLFEKVAARVLEQVEEGSFLKRKIFYWSLHVGRKYFDAQFEGQIPWSLERKYHLADKLVFQKIREKLGGRLRYPIAGGAPLSVETLKFFEALGMRIIEGYGMTEAHLIITLTPYGKTRYGSCGRAIGGVELRIADDGEILVKGPTLMQGYYNNPEATAEVIDADGWLHTGDVGHLDEDGYLFITDRKKNIIVTSGGKNVASAPIENRLKQSKYIEEVCLVGNHRKFISAILIPNLEALKTWARAHSIEAGSNQELVSHPDVIAFIDQELKILQMELARFETVKKFILLAEPLSIEDGELTPSLKIRRSVIEKRYRDQINQLYEE